MKRGQNDFSSWNEYSDHGILYELMGFMTYFGCYNVFQYIWALCRLKYGCEC